MSTSLAVTEDDDDPGLDSGCVIAVMAAIGHSGRRYYALQSFETGSGSAVLGWDELARVAGSVAHMDSSQVSHPSTRPSTAGGRYICHGDLARWVPDALLIKIH